MAPRPLSLFQSLDTFGDVRNTLDRLLTLSTRTELELTFVEYSIPFHDG